MLERNRLIQQCSLNSHPDCISPEPIPREHKNAINKSISSNDVPNTENMNGQSQNYGLSKSISGGNIKQTNDNGANEKQSTSSASGVSSPSNNSQPEEEEKYCIFCNQAESIIFVTNKSMNSHYWRSCPMLARCTECSQVVEVAAFFEHLIMECEYRELYMQCSQCSEAVKLSYYDEHTKECNELLEGCNRCPLCHENIEDEENSWKNHLMTDKACIKNTRVKQPHKQVTIQI